MPTGDKRTPGTFFSIAILLFCLPHAVESLSGFRYSGISGISDRFDHDDRARGTKLAICMSGAARTLVDDDVYIAFSQHVRGSKLAGGLFGKSPDFYMYVRTGDSVAAGRAWGANPVDIEPLNTAVQYLSPTSVEIDGTSGPYDVSSREELDRILKTTPSDKKCFTEGFYGDDVANVGRSMNMFKGWQTCHTMIEEKEKEAGSQYDRVMFTRPDILWTEQIPRGILCTNKATFAADWWNVVPRDLSKDFASIVPELFMNTGRYHDACCDAILPEGIIKCAMEQICAAKDMTSIEVGRDLEGVLSQEEGTCVLADATLINEKIKRANGRLFDR